MKDRLQEFKQKASELELSKVSPQAANGSTEDGTKFQQQAVVFEKEPIIESFLQEAQKLKDDILELDEDIKKLGQQNNTLMSSMRRLSVLKKEPASAKDIKIRAESLNKRLKMLAKRAKMLEAENGAGSVIARVYRTQHAVLFQQFQEIMFHYNDTLTSKQEKCKNFIKRQLEVAGKEVTDEELSNMTEQGKWDVFNENLLTEAKVTKAKLSEIEQRHKELINLETHLKDLKEIFLQISLLVEEQGEMLNCIEQDVINTEEYVHQSREGFKTAVKYKKKHPCRRMCCWCFPCVN
ncbi:syntaxin-19 [Latimeria chalumnae]|uniref:Syntaxin 19 n=1 Tax=Latimeria chalumnae TaxID=7897 RepID=H3AGQ3_LATCH|nr:PREDICTED: syntaxin-19 [Latimeria chalumnae]|eukprot:XP_006007999.1 PREDICTED: syntaxin-19 [Latimeria chalumnae]